VELINFLELEQKVHLDEEDIRGDSLVEKYLIMITCSHCFQKSTKLVIVLDCDLCCYSQRR
jgi:hypothetical protein